MTRMVPPVIHPSVKSAAERRMFGVIERAPGSEDWICLHSLGLAKHPSKRRAEIDYFLITPDGCFVLEVKGGRVARRDGVWEFVDRHGNVYHRREGPFEQAYSAMFALERTLRDELGTKRIGNPRLGYGVVMPDVEFNHCGVEEDPRRVYDRTLRDRRDGFRYFYNRLREVTLEAGKTSKRPRYSLSLEDREALLKFLRGDFELVPTLCGQAASAGAQMLRLTEAQYRTLDLWARHPRLRIEGGAGTGKSLLGLEAARREARAGKLVLLLCFSRNLARHLTDSLNEPDLAPFVTVSTVHSYFRSLVADSSLEEDFRALDQANKKRYFREAFPLYAQMALDECGSVRFDTLIVDEAQDVLCTEYLEPLSSSVRGGLGDGCWLLLLDSNNQAGVYGALSPETLARVSALSPGVLLSHNCRNTRTINEVINTILRPTLPSHASVQGPSVSRCWYSTSKQLQDFIRSEVRKLRKDGMAKGQLAVLFPWKPEGEWLALMTELELQPFGGAGESGDHDVFCTVSAFKGLERDFVILAGLEQLETEWWQSVAYVGMSRARYQLSVALHEDTRDLIETREQETLKKVLADGE